MFQGSFNAHRTGLQVNRSPGQGAYFAASHSSAERECSYRVQPMLNLSQSAEGIGDLVRFKDFDLCPLGLWGPDYTGNISFEQLDFNSVLEGTM